MTQWQQVFSVKFALSYSEPCLRDIGGTVEMALPKGHS